MGFDLVPRSPLNSVQIPANANGGRSSLSANHTTSFFLVSGFAEIRYETTVSMASESVRRLQAGLQSFLSMSRIDARRKKAKAFRLRHSQSFAKRRQRLSQAMVRSTIQRLGKTTNPLT